MSSVNLFSNKPKFINRPLTSSEILNLKIFNAAIEADPSQSSLNYCADPNLGTTWRKNVLRNVVHSGGSAIDFNIIEQLFPNSGMSTPTVVGSKRYFVHYQGDPDYNIYAAATVSASTPGGVVKFQLNRSNHTSSGKTSPVSKGMIIVDPATQEMAIVDDVDTTTDYAHLIDVKPTNGTSTLTIKANRPYLVLPANLVGGCGAPNIINSLSTIGYTAEIRPVRVTRGWKVCIDTLTGYQDEAQYTVLYDMQGNEVDAVDFLQAQNARTGLRATLNVLAMIGTPVTNSALVNAGGSSIDENHIGFYGLVPSLKKGGAVRYGYPSHVGFDLESDGDAILLYQDSRKKTKKFLVAHGLMFMLKMVNRTNLIVSQQSPFADWEAYRRYADYMGEADVSTAIAKLGIKSYQYKGLDLDFKKIESWSDYRFFGRDYYNGAAMFIPVGGITQSGRPISPIEFTTTGRGGWTGSYEEHFIDYRKVDMSNDIGGYVSESLALAVHGADNFVWVEPIKQV